MSDLDMQLEAYTLRHIKCSICVWGEKGHYNAICAHCKYVTYSKRSEPSFMTRKMAETLGLVKKRMENTDETD